MTGNKPKKYDLIFSLGGSCASAIQLSFKGLRHSSLPFDWLCHPQTEHLDALIDGFNNGFEGWLQEANLQELTGDERGNSKHQQYKDTFSGFCFIHDFISPPHESPSGCEAVRKKYTRRFDRLFKLLSRARKTLVLADVQYELDIQRVKSLFEVLTKRFPDNEFEFIIQAFNSGPKPEKIVYYTPQIRVNYIERRKDDSDFTVANKDWDFLHQVSLSFWGKQILQKQLIKSVLHVGKAKKNFYIYILKDYLPTLLMIQIYFRFVQFTFSLGRPRG